MFLLALNESEIPQMLMSPAVFSERGGISSDFLEEPLPISLSDVARNATRTC